MTLQNRTETVPASEIPYEIDAEAGLTEAAKQALLEAAAAGATLEKTAYYRERGPVSFEDEAYFCLTFLDNFISFLDTGLSPQELKVAAYTLRQMEYGNLVCLSQTSIANDLGLHRQAVNRHFRTLTAKGFFVKKNGHTFVNSTLFAKGLTTRMTPERVANIKDAHDTRGGKFKPTLKARTK
ncbi:replication/maintenance protein RepL [Pseudoxanthomonas taiwanensis]|uniref:Plasmid replication protein RepL domain-containing protein n=1 Tax=Pseudoxanthomonas taiwanensis TaxID=176598 RepID=A0A921TFR0_9GAMM|nr:replication/maintenance protein RepL [Pseudoxanthomonas taiwanensis]KAF1689274.1 hypothetical protein CR938_06580 [Pseudoxanthomonas taiwanensis]